MSNIDLRILSDTNEKMKRVVEQSRHLYRVSLNAMLASRKINVGIEGFVEVTSLLRNFSTHLNSQIHKLADIVRDVSFAEARFIKINKLMQLKNQALAQSKFKKNQWNADPEQQQHVNEIVYGVRRAQMEIDRCMMLIGVGENLTVMAKVESSSIPVSIGSLQTITSDMESIISNINKEVQESKKLLA